MNKNILVAIDGSDNSARALIEAKEYAECVDGQITILTVVEPLVLTYYGYPGLVNLDNEKVDHAKEVILKDALKIFDDFKGKVNTKLRKGNPADEILNEAEVGEYDLIIMGSRGLGAFSRTILGSVSNKVLNHAETNVLVIK